MPILCGQVFFLDSLKFFLSLYGHKLPVLAMDISSDSTLLVSGSADKNIKIWGLDFGDCHRSLFAHGDSIMQVRVCPAMHAIVMNAIGGSSGMLSI
jgi:U3 small nucleolar RNA-associated protein 12